MSKLHKSNRKKSKELASRFDKKAFKKWKKQQKHEETHMYGQKKTDKQIDRQENPRSFTGKPVEKPTREDYRR